MPLEPAPVNWFSQFTTNWPLDGDLLVEGDNHIRNIKNAILQQFPSLGNVAMTLSAATLNLLSGLTATGAQINALQSTYGTRTLASTDDVIDNFPAGTIMSFQQTAAPTGWTKEVTHDNKALRVVTGAAGNGGSNSFSSVLSASVNVSGTTLTTNQIPQHTHSFSGNTANDGAHTHTFLAPTGETPGSTGAGRTNGTTLSTLTTDAANPATHSHFYSGTTNNNVSSNQSHDHNFNLDVQYVDLILAAKD